MTARTLLATLVALVAFAGNSILCRLALGSGTIDPASFTAVRLASGALALAWFLRAGGEPGGGSPRGALALFVYALAFSLAYVTLETGTGALLLFSSVQLTMLVVGWVQGERPTPRQVLGMLAALAGLVWLVAPGVTAPDPGGAVLMGLAGLAWGAYSLLGRGARRPALATARNFLLATPLGALTLVLFLGELDVSGRGLALAVTSGALTSGLGYVVWYAALRGHSATSAAVVQLAVPLLAALGGVVLLGEAATGRLVGSAVLTLGGVGVAVRRG